jgi:hypothetical protein
MQMWRPRENTAPLMRDGPQASIARGPVGDWASPAIERRNPSWRDARGGS